MKQLMTDWKCSKCGSEDMEYIETISYTVDRDFPLSGGVTTMMVNWDVAEHIEPDGLRCLNCGNMVDPATWRIDMTSGDLFTITRSKES